MQYTIDTLLTQLSQFIDSAIQNKKNGYKGYNVKFSQIETSEKSTEASSENPDFKKHTIKISVEVEHLDISSIEMQESEEIHKDYTKSLGLFACFTNEKAGLSQIFKLDLNEKLLKSDKVSTELEINTKEEGLYKFKVFFCDNYGFNHEIKEMSFNAKWKLRKIIENIFKR